MAKGQKLSETNLEKHILKKLHIESNTLKAFNLED